MEASHRKKGIKNQGKGSKRSKRKKREVRTSIERKIEAAERVNVENSQIVIAERAVTKKKTVRNRQQSVKSYSKGLNSNQVSFQCNQPGKLRHIIANDIG